MLTPRTSYGFSLLCVLLFASSGCNRNNAEAQKLYAENQRLRAELEQAKRGAAVETKAPTEGMPLPAPDIDVQINELWTQRFDDNEFRAKQRLADKAVRVTGVVDGVAADSVTLFGVSKRFGNVRMTVNLDKTHAGRIGSGLAALERNVEVTVQGKFVYERMCLADAFFVNPLTGKVLSSHEVAALARNGSAAGAAK